MSKRGRHNEYSTAWMNRHCGGGGIVSFPDSECIDPRLRGKTYNVVYTSRKSNPIDMTAYNLHDSQSPGIDIEGTTKTWAFGELAGMSKKIRH